MLFVLGTVLSRQMQCIVTENWLKEARKGFFGCYSVCETMKDTKEGYFIMLASYIYLCNSVVG